MDEVKANPTERPPDPATLETAVAVHPPAAVPPSAAEVFHEYAARVYNLARRMLGSDADAEDVTQEVLLQVVRKLPTFRGESAFPTWLHRVTVNAALAYRRKRAARSEHHDKTKTLDMVLEEDLPGGPVRRWSVGPEEAALDRETQELIERAIGALPEDYRDAFVLSDVEGLPNAEIGEMLGVSLSVVKNRLHRARRKLRDALAPHFEEVSA
jgi:RNA polymerase sigma-70 factor (ECF subfamily)